MGWYGPKMIFRGCWGPNLKFLKKKNEMRVCRRTSQHRGSRAIFAFFAIFVKKQKIFKNLFLTQWISLEKKCELEYIGHPH